MPPQLDLLLRFLWPGPGCLLIASRSAGLVWTAPGWGMPGLGWRIRLGLAVLLAALLTPGVGPSVGDAVAGSIGGGAGRGPIDLWLLAPACVIEAAVGMGLGLAVGLVVAAARQAGEIVGSQAGLAPSALLDPEGGAEAGEMTALGHLYGLVALGIFLALDGPLSVVTTLVESYRAIPPALGGGPPSPSLALAAFGRLGWALALAVRLAAPAGLALVLAGLALAWLSRAVATPTLSALAWPARSAIGVVLAWIGLAGLAAVLASAWAFPTLPG
jgi:flagellar biosynthetic protein FliR